MELRHLTAFVAVAEERSFTRAADRLHVVQSAVSATLRGLEAELGAALVDRSTQPVSLTDAGEAFLVEARRTLESAQAARDAVDQVRGGLRGTVRLGVMQARRSPGASVPEVLLAFRERHPAVEVVIGHTGGSTEMAGHVREGVLDLAFVSLTDRRPAGLDLLPLTTEPVALACHPDHPLAGRKEVELAELVDEVFAEAPIGWGTRMAVEQALAARGLTRKVTYEVNDVASVVEFVEHGLAIALMPESFLATQAHGRVVAVALADPPAFRTYLASSSERRLSAAVVALRDTVAELSERATPPRRARPRRPPGRPRAR
ncbi:LysR family transcriptional regulator [Conexibacter sp. SYSU D00693]|uniref:LysR family transcriptional regulator n=1 Tax=Conexibacter sp. SYSU D00693 TaxID=2812560 RepID=UPI00196B0E14|nr:LysR family transcriptional regulator [Conexibacter sp. SYSU D00693]